MGDDALRFPDALIFVKESLMEKEISAYQWNCRQRKPCVSGMETLCIRGGSPVYQEWKPCVSGVEIEGS